MPSKLLTFLASPDGVNRLNAAKARLNLTTAAIAQQAGVSADTVGRLWHPERGKRVGAANIGAIAAVLELRPEEIVSEEELQDAALAEAKRRIQEAISTEANILDLSDFQLTTVPESLGNLVNLTALYLDNNQLTTVPESLGNLVNLTVLNLDQNQLTTVPESLGNLTNLTQLLLNNNQLTTVPESLGNLVNLTALYLDNNQLTTVPESLGNLVNLTKLYLHNNQLTTVPESLGNLINLTELSPSSNQLTTVPESLGNLVNLVRLYLHENQLTTVPESLGNLVNLTELLLNENQLTTVPESLGNLVNLVRLYLHKNQLTTVPESLGNLVNLTELLLSSNQLTTVPEFLGNLVNLATLYLHRNQLTTVLESLGNLVSLTELYLSSNQLTTVPESLSNLKNLTRLDLGQNQLTTVPESLGNLVSLTELYLDRNELTMVPEFIAQFTQLQRLDLNDNRLAALPKFLEQLPNLQALLLHGNEQLGISDEILGSTYYAEGATPANPQDILSYYFRAIADRQPLNEAKLILVGFGNVGKTSLVDRLIRKKFDPNSKKTEGIQITQWNLRLHNTEDIKLHVWDFGGQEIMHSTHQFFLTERSLYLVVLNGRQGHEDTDAEYWLELIQSFGGDSPVIVVLNKVKEHPFDVNRSALKQKFPAIREFISTDCKAKIGLKDLQKAIDRETDRLEHLRDAFPTSWVAIKNRLSSMTDNYIPFEEYRRICQQDGEPDSSAQNSLAVHLHSLGIALNYKNDPRLRDTHVLNPHWVTNGIYKLLNAHDITDNKGELVLASLETILDCQNYPPARHGFLLELMRKFELCFPFQEDEHRYLIPDLLDKQQPPEAEDFNLEECLNFRYEYPILPEGLLPRFIVRTHVLSTPHLRWRTGAILEFEGNRALVKADRQDRSVTISVDGAMTSRRRLLAVIRSDFERIHSSFKFIPQAKVPVPSHPEVVLAYQDLVVREEANSNEFTEVVNGKIINLNARKLLGEIDLDGTRRRRPETGIRTQALRLFYSYSHKDEILRDTLEIRLKLLQRQGFIQHWHDRRIPAGTDWQDELDRNLEQADIILLLVSPDFLASDYCYKIEMTRALERYAAGEAIVIPILIRSGVDWNAVSFSHIQTLPTDLKPVPKWSDPDDAWLNIEQGIKQAIQEKMKRSRTLLKFEDFDGIKVSQGMPD